MSRLTQPYSGITRYGGVPTEQTTGRLHYNENLYGPSPKCLESLQLTTMEDLYLYESTAKEDLIGALAAKIGIPEENLFLNNGSAENLKSIIGVIARPGDTVLLPDPGWSYYFGLADYRFLNVIPYPIAELETKCEHDIETLRALIEKHDPKIVLIASPAMPTGNKMADEVLEDLIRSYPNTLMLIDEAYYGFTDYTLDIRRLIETYDNVVFSRTFSKFYGLANLRIGYGFCSTALRQVLWLDMPLHRLPHIVKRMAIAALEDDAYYDDIRAKILRARQKFTDALNEIEGVQVHESDTNFVYIRLVGYDAEKIRKIANDHGYLIRIFMGNEEKHLRITVGTEEMMEELALIMRDALAASKLY